MHMCYAQGGQTPTEVWVVTPGALVCVSAPGLRSESCRVLTDAGGAELHCACVAESGQLVLGRSEAIYLYGADERGPCFAFDGPKLRLHTHHSSLVVLSASRDLGSSVPASLASSVAAATEGVVAGATAEASSVGAGGVSSGGLGMVGGAGGGAVSGSGLSVGTHALQLYDLKHKYVAYSTELRSAVRWVVTCEERLLLVLQDGSLLWLEEKDWPSKLASLYRKHLYTTALSLAAARGADRPAIADIHREYAEHLCPKCSPGGKSCPLSH